VLDDVIWAHGRDLKYMVAVCWQQNIRRLSFWFAAGLEMDTSLWVHPQTIMCVFGTSCQENVSKSTDFPHQF